MSNEDNIRYRFSGYQLPLLELDETGHAYYYIQGVHPYYTSQPLYWRPGTFPAASIDMVGGNAGTNNNSLPETARNMKNNKLYNMNKF